MQIWVGLGNPGEKYARNRHNIGFMALDRIAEDHGFGPWKSKFQGQVSEGRFGSDKVLLLKPTTFMNLSGQSVGEAVRFHKLDSTDVTVFHDEIDLSPGRVRLKAGGGHAGHNGLRSIHQHLSPAYDRVRLGVGHPGHKDAVPGFVLHDFPKADQGWLDDLLRGISDGAPALAAGAGDRFLNAIALRVTPPRSSKGKPKDPMQSAIAKARALADAAPVSEAAKPAAPAPEPKPRRGDSRTPLQRLADKFR